ncbi:hypothetical protein OUZ56_028062 [Daphnia magna]|uniref:Uncharacterized protein n=1 Tax=Daphnia magna TaxID=35525 RepID=A0ABR0B3D2_9CRUS|nr:hypothetical protein OUZ56_028062 [Daphnia magna]
MFRVLPWTTTSRGRDSSRFPMSAMRKGRKSVSPVLPSGQVPEALTTKRLRPAKFVKKSVTHKTFLE